MTPSAARLASIRADAESYLARGVEFGPIAMGELIALIDALETARADAIREVDRETITSLCQDAIAQGRSKFTGVDAEDILRLLEEVAAEKFAREQTWWAFEAQVRGLRAELLQEITSHGESSSILTDQRDRARVERDQFQEQAAALRSDLATLTEEREIAKNHADRVKSALLNGADETRERLLERIRQDNAFCICGCPDSEHESYGEDGESCENPRHECVRVCAAAASIAESLRAEVARLVGEGQRKDGEIAEAREDLYAAESSRDAYQEEAKAHRLGLDSACSVIATKDAEISTLKSKLRSVGETFREYEKSALWHCDKDSDTPHTCPSCIKAEANAALARECEEMGK